MDAVDLFGRADIPWSSIPTNLLIQELAKRHGDSHKTTGERPACGGGAKEEYHTGWHVFALVLILVLSTAACGFPLLSRSLPQSRRTNRILFVCQHLGTGVLVATSFVHLLPTAFSSLTDPCLPYFFSEGYTPLPGFIAMVSALVVVVIESYLTTRGAGHSHSHNLEWELDDDESDGNEHRIHAHPSGGLAARRASSHRPADIALDELGSSQFLMAGISPFPGETPTTMPPSSAVPLMVSPRTKVDNEDEDDLDINMEELTPSSGHEDEQPLTNGNGKAAKVTRRFSEAPPVATPEEQKRLMLQCMLLEAGILFHSVFIGMAVSVATGPAFVVFLTAIGFHQTFEGLALGARIAAIGLDKQSLRPWFMVLAYGLTTPIGQAIGLGVHTLYDPMSQTGLLMVGIMNAISGGLLLFAGFVQLLAEDFLSEKSYKILKGKKRTYALSCVALGALLMAAVGAFA